MITFQKTKFFLFITDKNILLLSWKNNLLVVVKEYEISQILSSPESLIKDIPTKEVDLIIIPDYWIGNKFYPVSSKRASIVETFLSRRLPIDFPEVPDSKDFFEYLYDKKNRQDGIMVYFIQEELFYNIYKIISLHLFIGKITAPAFLWQAKFSRQAKEVNKGQKSIVHMYTGGIYLSFFSNGLFLFSRVISISSQEEYITQLSYEIMQSLRLFSQRVKEEVEKIYIISKNKGDSNKLQSLLDIEVEQISEKIALASPSLELVSKLGSVAFLDKSDFSESSRFLHIIPRQEKAFRRWTLFQNAGIAIGILIFLLMLIEAIFLPYLIPMQEMKNASSTSISIEDYISAADDLLYSKNKVDPSFLILRIMDSVPKDISIDEISMELEPSMILELNGIISVFDMEGIEKALAFFMENLKKNIPNVNVPSMEEIDIKKVGEGKFEFNFKLGISQEE